MLAMAQGSNITMQSGEVTLAESAATYAVTPLANQKPFFAIFQRKTCVYNVNACNSCAYFKVPSALLCSQNSWAEQAGYQISVAESRSSGVAYTDKSGPFNTVASGGISDAGQITFSCRNTGYSFPAGDYVWYAFYGSDLDNYAVASE